MSRLNSSLHPELTQNAIDKLFKSKIYTVLSFIDTDPELIVKITGLQFRNVLSIRKTILTKFSSTLVTGYKSYIQCLNECAIIGTGIDSLDELLGGGVATGNIYELCGTSPSGKTQIAMTIAVNISYKLQNQSVLYIDTRNDISGHRFLEIIEHNKMKIENSGDLMNKIKICRISESNSLLNFLHRLSTETSNYRLLIIDSVPLLYFRYIKDEKNEGFVFLNNLANLLRFIAVEHKMVVIVTNVLSGWSYENEDNECVSQNAPFLGKYWYHVPNTRINTKKLDDCEKWNFIVTKSSDCPIGKTAEFKITKGGVE